MNEVILSSSVSTVATQTSAELGRIRKLGETDSTNKIGMRQVELALGDTVKREAGTLANGRLLHDGISTNSRRGARRKRTRASQSCYDGI